ncbi:sensor histidine kinase [Niabella beijingensis]|uniref:sensor histidine kinase n=1 Tax=Niabella beijingensis TaxID=2872700 RepID=UPI001CBB7F11|nr:histidine kinase [Niabella beijingensis]MBZ4191431.1 histidine kinase [Niabella beijingensis]
MTKQFVPYKKILIIALLTAPLFAVFGSVPMPALLSGGISWKEIGHSFLTVVLTTLLFWGINALLLLLFATLFKRNNAWLRYTVSILLCGFLAVIIMKEARRGRAFPQRELRMHQIYHRFNGEPPVFDPQKMPKPPGGRSGIFFFFPVLQAQSINIIILILLEVILLRSRKERIEKENDLLRVTNLEAKHSLLKQQLQPHFLFNSLTIVKALIRPEPDKAAAYVDLLSDLLRTVVYSGDRLTVSIEEELLQVKNYLEMQQIRFGSALIYSFDIPETLMPATLPVYSIQLLTENALKHNAFTAADPLHIRVTGDAVQKTITVCNDLRPKPPEGSSNGMGLKNLEERCRLLGGEPLKIDRTGGAFCITLKTIEDARGHH